MIYHNEAGLLFFWGIRESWSQLLLAQTRKVATPAHGDRLLTSHRSAFQLSTQMPQWHLLYLGGLERVELSLAVPQTAVLTVTP